MGKKLLILLVLIAAVGVIAFFIMKGGFGGNEFLESELIGEGDGENVKIDTKEQMVEIYENTALPLINNLTKGTEQESEYDSLTVTLQTNMPGETYVKNMGFYSAETEGEIDQYVLFSITKDVMYVKISTDSTVQLEYQGHEQDLTYTSVIEYYITADHYYMRVASFEGSDTMMDQQKMAFEMLGSGMGEAFELIFDGELKEEWLDVEGTDFGSDLIDQGVASCYTALNILSNDTDESDFVDGETPELKMEYNGSTNTFRFKYINNTVIEQLDPDEIKVLSEHLS